MCKNVINNLIPSRAGNDYVGEDIFIFRQIRATLRHYRTRKLTFRFFFVPRLRSFATQRGRTASWRAHVRD